MALPQDITLDRGTRDSALEISQGKPIEISNTIYAYQPNTNKGLSFAMQNGGFESSGRRTFGHLEDSGHSQWVKYEGVTEVGGSQAVTGLVMDSTAGSKLTTGSRVFFPEINEIIRIDAAFASATTSAGVNRNFGRGVAATSLLEPGDKGLILPPDFPEGFTTGDALSNALLDKSFEMGETSEPVKVTMLKGRKILARATRF